MKRLAVIYVEGKSDKRFIECYLEHLRRKVELCQFIDGSVNQLSGVKSLIRRHYDEGRRVGLILDADSDAGKRLTEAKTELSRLGMPVSDILLLPNNREPGNLETLLEHIVGSENRKVRACLDQYEACLEQHSFHRSKLDAKAGMFAYCEAIGLSPKPEETEFRNGKGWNLESQSLDELRSFPLQLTA